MKIPLQDWAELNYNPPPSLWVLRKWVRAGQIYPPPEKVGVTYYVESTARRQTTRRPTLVERMKAGA